jgi:Ulp1 family protease
MKWKVRALEDFPDQKNSYDCGLFMCAAIHNFLLTGDLDNIGNGPFDPTAADARKVMALQLYKHDLSYLGRKFIKSNPLPAAALASPGASY